MPTFDGGDDFVWVLGPSEGLWGLVMFGQVAIDGGLEVGNTCEDAALEPTLGEDGEEALDRVEPRGGCRCEVEGEARMASQPFDNLRMLMSGVILEDHMDDLADWNLSLDPIEKANELLVPVLLHALPDDRTVEHVERGKERGRAVALIVVRHRPAAPLLQRQARLGAIQRLYLGFLVEGKHHRMGRWVHIKPHNIAKLLDKKRVVGQLELADTMRLKPVLAPNALHRTDADGCRLGHGRSRPVGRFAGRFLQGPGDNARGNFA